MSGAPAMRPLKRSLTIVNDPLSSDDVMMSPIKDVSNAYGHARDQPQTIQMLSLPLPGDPKHHCSMDPPLQAPPWKRATVATNSQGALQLPIPRSPPRLLTPRVSWSDIVSQSQEQDPRSPMVSSSAALGGASSPRTPYNHARQPPSPPCRMPCRRRPPSDDEGIFGHDENEGRFKREFDEVTSIGKGQFSTVFRARNKIDRGLYAVKRTQTISRGLQEWQLREVFALAAVGIEADACRNIVRYFSSWLEDGKLHIQTELCECSLRDRLAERCRDGVTDPRFQEKDLILVLRDVSCGLAVLHARNFVHLDIKPDNVLVSRGAEGCYKIADLGLAVAAMGSGCDDISEGDCRYLAKEVLRGDLSRLPKADVFSLGLVLYELAVNPKPLPCNGDEWHVLRTGHLDASFLPSLPEPLLTLLHRMVHATPAERPTCEEISRHPSIAPIDDGLLALQEEMRRRTLEAERNKQLADEYWAELLSMKKQELLSGGAAQPAVGGRPVASPVAPPSLGRYNTA